MTRKKSHILYIAIVMLALLVPFAGMAFSSAETVSAEKRDLSLWPKIYSQDGAFNTTLLKGMGDYFQDHFALRSQMVMANSALKNATVKSGSQDQVIIGRDGWLFFQGTIDDYLGRSLLSGRELYCATHNLSLMQKYAERNGSRLILMVAPNKNSLYGKYMPYNYIRSAESNAGNLKPLLKQMGVSYVDLFELFGAEREELYFKRDSHWNNKGALLAYQALMGALEKPHDTYLDAAWEVRKDHKGDIDEMLYLLYYQKETQYYPDKAYHYTYTDGVADNMAAWIETRNDQKTGCLLMYRDSFGESLVPFVAEEFAEAYFSRFVPYDLTDIETYQPDYVVIQKVERNLIDFAADAPIIPGQTVENMNPEVAETSSTIQTETDGSYLVVRGEVDMRYIRENTDIFVSVYSEETGRTETYQTAYLSGADRLGNRYCVYLDDEALPDGNLRVQLIVSDNDNRYIIQSKNL